MEAIAELDRVFPELKEISIHYHDSEEPNSIPYFLRFIIAAALQDKGPSCVFVLPQPETAAYLIALFAALVDTKQHFEARQADFASFGLKEGGNVRLLPEEGIFQYAGYFKGTPLFCLRFIGGKNKNAIFSVPFDQVMRLSPTQRQRPTGKTIPRFDKKMPAADLDGILNMRSYGNTSIFKNKIILHCSRRQMGDFLSCWELSNDTQKSYMQDLTDLPLGHIKSDGELQAADKYQSYGEPLIACTDSLSSIGAFCSKSADNVKSVITFNKKAFIKNSYDVSLVLNNQKIILLTDSLESKEVDEIRNMGISIWGMEEKEVLLGIDTNNLKREKNTPIKKMVLSHGRKDEQMERQIADSPLFAQIHQNILALRRGVTDEDAIGSVIAPLQRLFWRLSELIAHDPQYASSLISQAGEIKKAVLENTSFIKKEFSTLALDTLDTIINDLIPNLDKHTQQKHSVLTTWVYNNPGAIVLTRNIEAALAAQRRLGSLASGATFLTYAGLNALDSKSSREYRAAFIIGWPGGNMVLDLLQAGLTGNIASVLYPHETKSMEAFFRQRERISKALKLSTKLKSEITSLPELLFDDLERSVPQSVSVANDTEEKSLSEDVFDIAWTPHPPLDSLEGVDNSLKAKFVSLNKDMCVYLTSDYRVSVISSQTREYKRKPPEDLAVGDIVVFRQGGEKDLLREISVSIYGESYNRFRAIAGRWKLWLRSLDEDPMEIRQKLISAGLTRHPMTISMWLNDEDLIGPQNLNDTFVIAQATGEEKNIKDVPIVADAIKKIRGVHIEAGFKLTDIVMRDLVNSPATEKTLPSLSNVNVYTIEGMHEEYQDIPRNLVNAPKSVLYLANIAKALSKSAGTKNIEDLTLEDLGL